MTPRIDHLTKSLFPNPLHIRSHGEGRNTYISKGCQNLHAITGLAIEVYAGSDVTVTFTMIAPKYYWRDGGWVKEMRNKKYTGIITQFGGDILVDDITLKEMMRNSKFFDESTMRTVWEDVPE